MSTQIRLQYLFVSTWGFVGSKRCIWFGDGRGLEIAQNRGRGKEGDRISLRGVGMANGECQERYLSYTLGS